MGRKYKQQGYMDSGGDERAGRPQQKKPEIFGPRTPNMPGQRSVWRCASCAALLPVGIDSQEKCPNCGAEGAMLTGDDAQTALRRGLTYLNLARAGRQRAADAARLVEGVGGPDQLIQDVARRELTLRSLAPDRRLALEMAVDERAEVDELERQWRAAEEIAEIADGTLSAEPAIDEELRKLRERLGRTKPDQPSG